MAKKQTRVASKRQHRKAVKHHKKAARHHHVSVRRVHQARQLFVFSTLLFVMAAAMLGYTILESRSSNDYENTNTVNYQNAGEQYSHFPSKLGFAFTYNTVIDTAQANVGGTGGTFMQPEDESLAIEWKERAYESVTIKPKTFDESSTDVATVTNLDSGVFKLQVVNPRMLKELQAESPDKDPLLAVIEQYAPQSVTNASINYTSQLQGINDVTIGSYQYKEAIFTQKVQLAGLVGDAVSYSQKQYLYVTQQQGQTYVISLSSIRVGVSDDSYVRFKSYIESIEYAKPTAQVAALNVNQAVLGISSDSLDVSGTDLLKSQFGSLFAPAYAQEESGNSSETVALYEPATVRIFNFYCAQVTLTARSAVQVPPACTAGAGTGFIVSKDGYLGTNGHVAVSTPAELLATMVQLGEKQVISAVAEAFTGGVNSAALEQQILSDEGVRTQVILYLRYIPSSFKVDVVKESQQYAVELGEGSIAVNESIQNVFEEEIFIYNDSVAKAKLVASDFNPVDPLTKLDQLGNKFTDNDYTYTASDVAVLKLEADLTYPVVKLGAIDTLTSGDQLLIIGYPGVADNKQLVSQDNSTPTATTGIVSAIRDAVGTNNKLIQTDTTIDRGNSGGPAFNKQGEVIGLATYGASSTFGGEFNYIRDVKDLRNLLDKESVTYNQGSEVQALWESGISQFNKRYYSAAIKDFEKVQELYPAHSQAASFITKAKAAIERGEEASNFSAILLPIGIFVSVAALIGVGVAVVVHKKHKPAAQVAMAGMMPPQSQPTFAPAQMPQAPGVVVPQQPAPQTPAVISPQAPSVVQTPAQPAQAPGVVVPPQPAVVQPQPTQPTPPQGPQPPIVQ